MPSQIGTDRVRPVAANDHAPHAALLQGFDRLPQEGILVYGVRLDDDDAPDVLLADGVNGLEDDEVLLARHGRGVWPVCVDDGGRPSRGHAHRSQQHLQQAPILTSAARCAHAKSAGDQRRSSMRGIMVSIRVETTAPWTSGCSMAMPPMVARPRSS